MNTWFFVEFQAVCKAGSYSEISSEDMGHITGLIESAVTCLLIQLFAGYISIEFIIVEPMEVDGSD